MYLIKKYITRRCRQCGTKGSMYYLGKKCIGEREVKKLKETDSTGRRVQPYYVYGKVYTYKTAKRCKQCGYTEYKTFEETEWDDDNLN